MEWRSNFTSWLGKILLLHLHLRPIWENMVLNGGLMLASPTISQLRKYPDLPADTYWADGFEEQYVMVIPSKKLVIVRLGVSHHGFDITKLVNGVISALPGGNGNR